MKKFLLTVACALIGAACILSGCVGMDGNDGKDGKDGKDVSIYEIYDAVNAERQKNGESELSFLDFVGEYLSYSGEQIENLTSRTSIINRSLMSGVSVLTRFAYNTYSGFNYTQSHKVYVGAGAIIWLDKTAGDAYVVTNCHVVYDDTAVQQFCRDVRLYLYGSDVNAQNYVLSGDYEISGDENYRIEATVIGASLTYDIALLEVKGSEVLKNSSACAATFSSDEFNHVGDEVYAVGYPEGDGMSVISGIISRDSEYINLNLAEGSDMTKKYRVMRITAPVNGGNSGGGLYNSKGQMVGIVNARSVKNDVVGFAYALPASSAKRLLKLMYDRRAEFSLIYGGVKRAYIGITTSAKDWYSEYNEDEGYAEIYEKVTVTAVDGSSKFSSIKAGDVLESFLLTSSAGEVKEQIDLTRNYMLGELMLSARAGDTVELTVSRGSATFKASATISESDFVRVE